MILIRKKVRNNTTQKKNIICLNVKIIVGQTQNRCYKTRLQKLVTRYIEGQLCVHHKHS